MKSPGYARYSTGLEPLDRVLGGGAVRGGAVLFWGDSGVGKSTLLMQAMSNLADSDERVLYVSGEESESQIAAAASRIGGISSEVLLFSETDLDVVLETVEHQRPACLVVDSVQTMHANGIEGLVGGVTQTRHATALLVEQAKRMEMTLFLVCHITKSGELGGPKTLEHLVDTVMGFEAGTEQRRILSTSKNRFGSTAEVGLFEMTKLGLRVVEAIQ